MEWPHGTPRVLEEDMLVVWVSIEQIALEIDEFEVVQVEWS